MQYKATAIKEQQQIQSRQKENTVWCCYNAVNFLKKYSQKTPLSSPVRARYGVSFVDPASD